MDIPFNLTLTISDEDYPIDVYERPTGNFGLFDLDTAFFVTELYRWVKFEDGIKHSISKLESDARELVARNRTENPKVFINTWRATAFDILNKAKWYSTTTTTIQSLANQCLTSLQTYAKTDVTKVKVFETIPSIIQPSTEK